MTLAQLLTGLGFHHLGFIMLPLTHMGNLFLLFGLAMLLGLWLLSASGFRAALLWGTAFWACVLSLALLKIYFAACPIEHWYLRSPSGHSAMSLLIYGAMACCAMRDAAAWRQKLVLIVSSLLIGGIAISRILLEMHSGEEVLLGLAVGGVFLLGFCGLYRKLPQHSLGWQRPLLALLILFLLLKFVMRPISLEAVFQGLSFHWQLSTHLCEQTPQSPLLPPPGMEQEI